MSAPQFTPGHCQELFEAATAMFAARAALEIAPTHNNAAFDKAYADHALTLERLQTALAKVCGETL